jgi:hypothetical protein
MRDVSWTQMARSLPVLQGGLSAGRQSFQTASRWGAMSVVSGILFLGKVMHMSAPDFKAGLLCRLCVSVVFCCSLDVHYVALWVLIFRLAKVTKTGKNKGFAVNLLGTKRLFTVAVCGDLHVCERWCPSRVACEASQSRAFGA